MVGLGILATWSVIAACGVFAAFWWSQRAWQKRRELSRWTKFFAGLVAASTLLFGFGTLLGLVKAFAAVGGESLAPSQKARALAEGIATAMNCTALGALLGLPSVIALALVARTRNRREG